MRNEWATKALLLVDKENNIQRLRWRGRNKKLDFKRIKSARNVLHRLPANDGEIQRTEMVLNINQKPNCTGKL